MDTAEDFEEQVIQSYAPLAPVIFAKMQTFFLNEFPTSDHPPLGASMHAWE